jgi:Tfp pilus assembly PilM family ATPase/Tfp pilus assembly protein PilN
VTERKHKSGRILCVELGPERVKILQFVLTGGAVRLERFGVESLDGDNADPSAVVAAMLDSGGFVRQPAVALLPRAGVTVRMIELPSTDPVEIADMVQLQLGKQTPYSEDEIVSGYRVVGSMRDGYSRAMVVIVRRDALRHTYHALEAGGLEIERLSFSSEGLLGWYAHAGLAAGGADAGADVVLDVDAASTEFALISGGALVFSRAIPVGAAALAGEPGARERLGRDVHQCLETCRTELDGVTFRRALLTGAGGGAAGLTAYLEETLSLAVEVRDTLEDVVGDARPEAVRGVQDTVSLTAAAGAAARPDALEINLVPDAVALRRGLTEKARGLTLLGILVMACLVSASVIATIRMGFKRDRLAELRAAVEATDADARRLETMRAIVGMVSARRAVTTSALALLNAVHDRLPDAVALDEIVMELERDEGQVRLGGAARERADVSAFVRALEETPLYRDVRVEGGTTRDRETGQFTFRIVCTLEKTENGS